MKHSGHEEIAARAYQIWEAEGRPEGKAEQHWARAEQEICWEDRSPNIGSEREPAASHVSEDGEQAREQGCCGGWGQNAPPRDASTRLGVTDTAQSRKEGSCSNIA